VKVVIAKTAGFCMGVKRAVDLALEHASKAENGIKTLGPLIHNSQTVEMLKQRGVTTLNEDEELNESSTLLIRAHGVPPEIQKNHTDKGHKIIDGTCPKVKTVHKTIERFKNQGYSIIITGDQGHAEVIGLSGYAKEAGHLVQTPDDIEKLPEMSKICLVSQTTFDRTLFDQIADAVRAKYKNSEIIVKKTICSATDLRQTEVAALAKQVNSMIVVGGKNSANTKRLAKISRECGTPTQHVETEKDINWQALSGCDIVGITAGASTPDWMIKRIADYLQFTDSKQKHSLKNTILHIMDIFANLNLFVALGAVAIYYVSCYLQNFTFSIHGAALSFLYFFSMYLWNSLASIESTQHHGISRYRFYRAHFKILLWISGISITTLLTGSFFYNKSLFYLLLIATLAGSAYHMTFVPKKLRSFFHYKNLKDIPTSRDLFVALAWGTVLTFSPQVLNSSFELLRPVTIATFFWIFTLAFLRSLIFDLRDIEGDRIMGRETLITIVGDKRARKAIHLIIWFCATLLLFFPALMGMSAYQNQRTIRFLFQIPTLFYVSSFVKWNPKIRQRRSALFNLLADGLFYLAGLGAALSVLIIH